MKRSRFLLLAAGAPLAASLFVTAVHGGDLERLVVYTPRFNQQPTGNSPCCAGTNHSCQTPFAEVYERWPTSTFDNNGSIPWKIVFDPTTHELAPGLSYCATPSEAPGYAALLSAADAWTNTPPDEGPGHTIPFPPVPVPQLQTVFKLSQLPAAVAPPSVLMADDGANYVAFVDDARNATWQIFSTLGTDHAALARTDVHGQLDATGTFFEIDGFDTAFNAITNQGRPFWSWIADQSGTTFASHESFIPGPGFTPGDGYADIQGVATHEFGHAAGLGHSVVDSESSGGSSLTPTMFPFAQVQTFTTNISMWNMAGCVAGASGSPQSDLTLFGGLIGRSARSLEADDICAISRGYPDTATFPSTTGSISGTVFGGSALAGASVVAIAVNGPDSVRVGTLAYDRFPGNTGTYEISGLEPGAYYVYAEPIDRVYLPSDFDIPNYVLFPQGWVPGTAHPYVPACTDGRPPPIFTCCNQTFCAACNASNAQGLPVAPPIFLREFFNTGDVANEASQLATVVHVTAGSTTSSIDFVSQTSIATSSPAVTEVGPGASPSVFSRRGIVVPTFSNAAGTTPSVVTIRVQAPSSSSGQPVTVRVRNALTATLVANGELREVPASGGTTFTGTLSGAGTASFTYTLNPATDSLRSLFVQSEVNGHFTNWTKVFVARVKPL